MSFTWGQPPSDLLHKQGTGMGADLGEPLDWLQKLFQRTGDDPGKLNIPIIIWLSIIIYPYYNIFFLKVGQMQKI